MENEDDLIPSDRFLDPPKTENSEGRQRRVGYEMEYRGVEMHDAAEVIADLFGGEVGRLNSFAYTVAGSEAGDFSVEVDAAILKDRAYLQLLDHLGVDLPENVENTDSFDDLVKRVATTVVPFEIVTPPLDLDAMPRLDEMRERLRERGAEGTDASVLYAFGLHINPEAVDFDAESILAHLRGFILLADWIRSQIPTDWSRRIVPYIAGYPERYVRRVLDPDYTPSLRELMRDYLDANPNRNRAFDLLPILSTAVDNPGAYDIPENVKARPAYHYRLPNCTITDPEWRIAQEWNGWVWIERAADDRARLEEASVRFLEEGKKRWLEGVSEWLKSL